MLQHSSSGAASPARPEGNPADRRLHTRIPSAKLGITQVQIRNRPSASLVDLSSGGALLELPFQLPPESRVGVQLESGGHKLEVPFQLLRCYVADLKGRIRYHAAGAFDNLLNLDALSMRASSAIQRLMTSLERLERGVQKAALQSSSDAQFHEILSDLITWLRRGESVDLVIVKLKARLTHTYRSLLIIPATTPMYDRATSMECFGLTFKAKTPLTAYDRRFLRANAQLISLLEDIRRELRDEDDRSLVSEQVVYTPAEWLKSRSGPASQPTASLAPRVVLAPLAKTEVKAPVKAAVAEDRKVDYLAALRLDPAFA